MYRSIHENTKDVLKITKTYGKNGPFPDKALKILEKFRLKSKIKKETLAKRKAKKFHGFIR